MSADKQSGSSTKPTSMAYEEFIQGWKSLADNPDALPREKAAAAFYLKLGERPDGQKRIEHFLGRAMKARFEGKTIHLLGYEKDCAATVVAPLLPPNREHKPERKALIKTLSTGDASESAEYTRREWGGRASSLLGWAMLLTITGKQGLDHALDKTTDKVRQIQLRGMVDHIQKNPPPQNNPQAEAQYYAALDSQVKGLVGTVRDQYPWLSIISATGAGILIHFGGQSREKAHAAQNELVERTARYTAQLGADLIEKAATLEKGTGRA
jgi:hypothetical protein